MEDIKTLSEQINKLAGQLESMADLQGRRHDKMLDAVRELQDRMDEVEKGKWVSSQDVETAAVPVAAEPPRLRPVGFFAFTDSCTKKTFYLNAKDVRGFGYTLNDMPLIITHFSSAGQHAYKIEEPLDTVLPRFIEAQKEMLAYYEY